MPTHTETCDFPYSTSQLYALVADVEKYPEFIPWCRAIRIVRRDDAAGWIEAQMVVGFKGVTERYTSRITHTSLQSDNAPATIHVELVEGPFSTLMNHWEFIPDASGNGSTIEFQIKFEFSSKTLEKLIGLFFQRAVEKLVGAFSDRADALYG